MTEFQILKAAINKVRVLKYALGILGIGSALAILKTFEIENYKIPVFSIVIFLILMLFLYLISKIASSKEKHSRNASNFLIYFVTILICVWAAFFTSSVFFDFPKPISNYSIFKQDTIVISDNSNKDSNVVHQEKKDLPPLVTPSFKKSNKANDLEKEEIAEDQLEISIQLSNSTEGVSKIMIGDKTVTLLNSSTPTNPRIHVSSDPNKTQVITIVTREGDTCFLSRIFDKKNKGEFPIRFIPECNK
jgi:hypothetical protein